MSKQRQVTTATIKSDLFTIAEKDKQASKKADGTVVIRTLTAKQVVKTTNDYIARGESVKDALAIDIGGQIINSAYNLNKDCFQDHFDQDGNKVNLSNTDAWVKAKALNIKDGAYYLKTSGSQLASGLRYGITASDSKKLGGIIHSVLVKDKNENGEHNPMKIQHRDNFDKKISAEQSKSGYHYIVPAQLTAIADRLESSELDLNMEVQDIRVGKRHAKKGGCHITKQSLLEWIADIRELATETLNDHKAEMTRIANKEQSKKNAQSKRDKSDAKAKSKARLMAQRLMEMEEILKNESAHTDKDARQKARVILNELLADTKVATK